MEMTVLYLMVKIPLYAYDTYHDAKHAIEHYRDRFQAVTTKVRRIIGRRA